MNWSDFVNNLFNLCIVPFKNNSIFVGVAGLLCVVWLFRCVYRLIRNEY